MDAGADPRAVSIFYLTSRFGTALEVLLLLAALVATLIPLRRFVFTRPMRVMAVVVTGLAIVLELVFGGMMIRFVQGMAAGLFFAIAGFLMKREESQSAEMRNCDQRSCTTRSPPNTHRKRSAKIKCTLRVF
jgi:hypothetical protein